VSPPCLTEQKRSSIFHILVSTAFLQLLARSLLATVGQWTPYAPSVAVLLALLLLVLGIGIVLVGSRIKNPIQLPRPGKGLKIVIEVVWILSILILLRIYRVLAERTHNTIAPGPILPITIASAIGTFFYLAYITRHDGIIPAVGNGFIGAMAGPMVFEFPFDWIVIPLTKAPLIYLVVFFAPLFAVEFTTFSLLLLSKRFAINRYSMYSLGAMFLVFAAWALVGFSYPSNPVSFGLNAISKVLSFTTIVALCSREKRTALSESQAKMAATA
jgi:hypothetical protein